MNHTIDRVITNPVSGEKVTFICTSAETNGLKSVIEIELQPTAEGPPLHYHKAYSETFRILDGELNLQIGKEHKRAKKGETYKVEKSQTHSFRNDSGSPARIEVTLSPGHEGFENAISILFGLSKDGLVSSKGLPKKLIHLAIINQLSDSHFTGVFSLVSSILKFFINSNKMEMVQSELIDKYGRNFTKH